jgi:hypothetical protein
MEIWVIIVGIILVILLVVLIILNLKTVNINQTTLKNRIIYPFSSHIDPQTGKDKGFVNSAGQPQISCPTGTKINIVGAFFDIFDPYAECSASVSDINPLYAFMCVPSVMNSVSCSSDKDCPDSDRFTCDATAKKCRLRENPAKCNVQQGQNLALRAINGKNYCVDIDICGVDIEGASKTGVGVPNPVCSPGSSSNAQCAMRDASATVAAKCDGKQTCPDLSMADFGDYPCVFPPMANCITNYDGNDNPIWSLDKNSLRSGYCGLPYIPGYTGGVPSNSSTSISDPASSNLGYTMHGIYTCIAE